MANIYLGHGTGAAGSGLTFKESVDSDTGLRTLVIYNADGTVNNTYTYAADV